MAYEYAQSDKGGYTYKQNAREIFEDFFGTNNPFAAFGFGETAPFASKLNKPGPKESEPVSYNLECTLRELYNGCVKKFDVTRKRFSPDGQLVDETKQLVINVKPGWKKGTKITFPGEGDESKTATTPDIVFVVVEKADPAEGYQREGNNLIYTYKLSLADALSDCSLQLPTLDNRQLSYPCPEVVSPYYEKKIAGMLQMHLKCTYVSMIFSVYCPIGEGMPISKHPGTKGDLIIRFHILFPKHLNGDKKLKVRELLANEPLQN